jgi:phenylpyruvate tautomerase PptA (4-oxalocrotonate tautomerase family)
MPLIRINCPENSLTSAQKERLAPMLIDALMRQEVDPVTDAGKEGTLLIYNEISTDNCFPGGKGDVRIAKPFWVVELFADAGFFNQKRRDAAQLGVGEAFVKVLGDDGSSVTLPGGTRVAPAFLERLYVLMMEIPEGNWGAWGHTVSALEIAAVAGTDKNAGRFKELQENTAKLKAARVS